MPHVRVQLWPGKSQQQKQALADAITRAVVHELGEGDESVSVAIEEVPPHEWRERVYRPEIAARLDELYKRPGYSM